MLRRIIKDDDFHRVKEVKEKEYYGIFQIIGWVSLFMAQSFVVINEVLINQYNAFFKLAGLILYGYASLTFLLNVLFVFYFFVQKEKELADHQLRTFYISPFLYILVYILFYLTV